MDALISLKHLPQFARLCFSGKMVESKKALPKETRPSYYGNYGPPFAAAAAMAMAASAAASAWSKSSTMSAAGTSGGCGGMSSPTAVSWQHPLAANNH